MAEFTVAAAVAEVARLKPVLDELVTLRADAAELAASMQPGGAATALGGLAELKAAQARLDELVGQVHEAVHKSRGSRRSCSTSRPSSTANPCCCAGWRATTNSSGTTASTSRSPGAAG